MYKMNYVEKNYGKGKLLRTNEGAFSWGGDWEGWGVGLAVGELFEGPGVSGGGWCFPVPLIERLSTADFD